MDLTEAEDIKKRWQEYMGELYKKHHHYADNRDDVITGHRITFQDAKSSGSQEASL